MKPLLQRGLVLAAPLVIWAVPAAGDSWSDRTILSFSEPVMVPGPTLQPGTYVFTLLDSSANRHLVQIRNEGVVEGYRDDASRADEAAGPQGRRRAEAQSH